MRHPVGSDLKVLPGVGLVFKDEGNGVGADLDLVVEPAIEAHVVVRKELLLEPV